MAIVTISRQVGSGSKQIATEVARLLSYRFFDKRLMIQVAAEVGLMENEVVDFSEDHYKATGFLERLFGYQSHVVASVSTRKRDSTGAETLSLEKLNEAYCIDLIRTAIRAAYKQDNVVILGRGSQAILQDLPNVFHVRVIAPLDVRVRRIQAENKRFSTKDARDWVIAQDQKIAEYLKRFFGINWDDPTLYHWVINTGKLKPQSAAEFIARAITYLEPAPILQGQTGETVGE
jgi:cytidylate kinase